MVKVPFSNSFLERRDSRRKFSESLGPGASLASRLCQRISLGSVNDGKGSSFSQVQHPLTDVQDSTRDRSRRPVKTGPGLAGVALLWDPTLSSGRVVPPSDFVFDSSELSFLQTKENWHEILLPRPSTPQTLTHIWNSFSSELPLMLRNSSVLHQQSRLKSQPSESISGFELVAEKSVHDWTHLRRAGGRSLQGRAAYGPGLIPVLSRQSLGSQQGSCHRSCRCFSLSSFIFSPEQAQSYNKTTILRRYSKTGLFRIDSKSTISS